jgi:hypothetical protein
MDTYPSSWRGSVLSGGRGRRGNYLVCLDTLPTQPVKEARGHYSASSIPRTLCTYCFPSVLSQPRSRDDKAIDILV